MSNEDSMAQTSRLRVVHLTTRITNGGSEQRIFDALGTINTCHLIAAGSVTPGKNADRLRGLAEIRTLDSLKREPAPIDDLRSIAAIRRLLLDVRPDVLHTHQSKAGLLGRLAARTIPAKRRPKVIHSLSMASFGDGYGKIGIVFEYAERVTHQWVDEFLVVGSDLAASFSEIGVPDAKLTVVRSSLDLQPFADCYRRRDFKADPLKLLFVGSIDERKGVHHLPAVVEALARRRPVTLTIVGEGHLRSDLEREAGERGVNITFAGYRHDVHRFMAEADILLLPSSAEGLPQVLVQASICGLPFVSFDVHGCRELLSYGSTGLVTGERTAQAMSDALECLLAMPQTDARPDLPIAEWGTSEVTRRIAHAYNSAPKASV